MDGPGSASVGVRTEQERLSAEVVSVGELLRSPLRIPDYQRPYKWTVRNVAQLIEDVDTFRGAGRYRVGTVILHRDGSGRLDIVDGQQRFITFCLIARAAGRILGEEAGVPDTGVRELPEAGLDISRVNLTDNYRYALEVLAGRRNSLKGWVDFLFGQCEVVKVTLTDIDEAFQMFDSQNARGRALYPTDLLKAFHIREMRADGDSGELRLRMVRLWEDIPPESVNELFSEYLFKIRRWANGHDVPPQGFATEHVGLFKGIREAGPHNRDANARNRWALPFLYAKNYTDDFAQENATLIRYGAIPPTAYPFQIDQPVLNGETFFLMVDHYYRLGQRCGLFRDDETGDDDEIFAELRPVVDDLDEHRRKSTYRFVRNLFDCLVLYYIDRFGDQDLERAVRLIAAYALALRVQQKQVRRDMVSRYALGSPPTRSLPSWALFRDLREALRAQDFLRRPMPSPDRNGYPELDKYFDEVPGA